MSRIDEQLSPPPPVANGQGAQAPHGRVDPPDEGAQAPHGRVDPPDEGAQAPHGRVDAPDAGAQAPVAVAPEPPAPAKGTPGFVLRAGEPLAGGIVRVAGEQIDAITRRLRSAGGVGAKDVHESRKSLKRLRALSRLLRPALGTDGYRRENGALRDSARHLAGARDAEVMVATLEGLVADRNARRDGADEFEILRAHLLAERERASEHLHADAGPARRAAAELDPVRQRTASWLAADAGFAAVEPGLRRMYREGRERYRVARRDPTAEHLHEWRKRVKDLRYCAELLSPVDPDRLAEVAERADHLGEALGDEHDLTVLEAFADAHRDLFATPDERKRLRKLIRRRRAELRREALRQGRGLYARRPRRFTGPLARAAARNGSAAACHDDTVAAARDDAPAAAPTSGDATAAPPDAR
jgi:CHAD domain-containing protein